MFIVGKALEKSRDLRYQRTLGTVGMGEVYRARDTRLKREVAIKVLLEVLAADTQRMGGLERG